MDTAVTGFIFNRISDRTEPFGFGPYVGHMVGETAYILSLDGDHLTIPMDGEPSGSLDPQFVASALVDVTGPWQSDDAAQEVFIAEG